VHPEIDQLKPKLKEVLYDCAVELKATKAALYLLDGSSDRFELATEYGFRSDARTKLDRNHPIVDRCGRGRTPFYLNGVSSEPRFAEVMFEVSSDRLLAAPLFHRGQLVGLIDMRDKAGKALFEDADVPRAQKIADRILDVFPNKSVFGQRFLTLSDADDEPDMDVVQAPSGSPWVSVPGSAFIAAPLTAKVPAAAPPQAAPTAPIQRGFVAETFGGSAAPAPVKPVAAPAVPKPAPRDPADIHVPRIATIVADARAAMQGIVAGGAVEEFGDAEIVVIREHLRSILLIPGVLVASFTAFHHLGGVQEIAARALFTDDAKLHLQSKLATWLMKRGEHSEAVRTNVHVPDSPTEPPLTRVQLRKVFTAPIGAATLRGMYLTVAFAEAPDRATHEMLASMLAQLQVAIEHSMEHEALLLLRSRVIETLLEPGFTSYPDLRRHSEAVAALSESFARFLEMSAQDVETVRTIGYLHDVGMRLLDYERLYRKKKISEGEMEILREHPVVGAALVEPLLGSQIAYAILCHHERVDGTGYPTELQTTEIPLATRIVQVCDVYVTMTDPRSYAPEVSHEEAVAMLERGAGTEFDGELVKRFVEMLEASARA
jgi:putative nucleotidyltransferase with HDIG domain